MKWINIDVYFKVVADTELLCVTGDSDSKESACNAGDLGLIPGSGRSPGDENGYPLQYSCLENSMGRGAWWAPAHGVPKSQTRLKQLSTHTRLCGRLNIA